MTSDRVEHNGSKKASWPWRTPFLFYLLSCNLVISSHGNTKHSLIFITKQRTTSQRTSLKVDWPTCLWYQGTNKLHREGIPWACNSLKSSLLKWTWNFLTTLFPPQVFWRQSGDCPRRVNPPPYLPTTHKSKECMRSSRGNSKSGIILFCE